MSSDNIANPKPVELRTATNRKIADLGERQVGLAFLGESGDEVMATNRFRLGDFNKPVLSCGVRVVRGATIHLELRQLLHAGSDGEWLTASSGAAHDDWAQLLR